MLCSGLRDGSFKGRFTLRHCDFSVLPCYTFFVAIDLAR